MQPAVVGLTSVIKRQGVRKKYYCTAHTHTRAHTHTHTHTQRETCIHISSGKDRIFASNQSPQSSVVFYFQYTKEQAKIYTWYSLSRRLSDRMWASDVSVCTSTIARRH